MRAALVLAAAVGVASALLPPAPATAVAGGGRVIVLRPGHAQLVEDGVVRGSVPLPRGAVTIATLVRAVGDPAWASMSGGGDVVLRAGISQRPGTELYVRAPARTVRLADSAAFLNGTRARVYFRGVTVTSAPAPGGRPAPESPHRPYLRYLDRSTVSIVSSTFEGLGAASTRNHGVTVGAGGVLSAVDSTFRAGSRGIDVYRAARVSLTRVRAEGNTEAGVLVNQAGAVRLTDVTASENTGTGIVLRGPLRAPGLERVASERNGTGVELSRLGGVPVGPLRTAGNRWSGIALDRCPRCVLAGVDATGDRTGILVERQSRGSSVTGGTVRAARRVGVMVAAGGVRLRQLTVESAPGAVGLRVPPGVPDARIESSAFHGGAVAVSIDGDRTSVLDTSVTGARTGVRIGGDATAAVVGSVRLEGTTELPAMPVRWIALLGLLVVAAAITLEVLRRLRERRDERTVSAPDHVTNTA